MIIKNHLQKNRFSYLLLIFAIISVLFFQYYQAKFGKTDAEYFSADSILQLKELNSEYKMSIKDLDSPTESKIVNQLFEANAFHDTQAKEKNMGLIASVKGDEKTSIILLEPVNKLSEQKLIDLAQKYEESVPEFEHVELDQNIKMFGEPAYIQIPNDQNYLNNAHNSQSASESESVVLSSEVSENAEDAVKIAIIDSGIDSGHEVFDGISVQIGWNTFDHNESPTDEVGHGTHIAGIIAGKAPKAQIVPYKIYSKTGGKLSNVIEAFNQAIDDKSNIINTSFGLENSSYALKEVVKKAFDNGIIVVSAAGNNNSSDKFYPAGYPETIAIAATNEDGEKLSKSNYGDWVDVASKGDQVYSSVPGNKYAYKTGTSQATAYVSAYIANLMYNEKMQKSDEEYDFSLKTALEMINDLNDKISSGSLSGVPFVKM